MTSRNDGAPSETARARSVVLIGLRGAGKTTVGRAVAARLQWPFDDLDDLALRKLGIASVRDVFARHGEAAWRDAESRALSEALDGTTTARVLALGGGAPMTEAIAAALRARSTSGDAAVVLLDCGVPAAARRLTRDPGDRPTLTGAGVVEELADLERARGGRYRSLATHVVDASIDDPLAVADAVLRALARP